MKVIPRSLLFIFLNILVTVATVAILWLAWIRPQQLAIIKELGPSRGTPPGTPEIPAVVIPTPTLPSLDVEVIEVKGVTGMGVVSMEVLTLERVGNGDLGLTGWQVMDEDNHVFTFPELLVQGGSIRIHSGAGRNTLPDLYWGLSEPIWQSGEMVTVIDSAGNVRARARLP